MPSSTKHAVTFWISRFPQWNAIRPFHRLTAPTLAPAASSPKVDEDLKRKLTGIASTVISSGLMAFLVSIGTYHSLSGPTSAFDWTGYVAFASAVHGSWEPTGLLALAVGVTLPLFLALTFDRAVRQTDQRSSHVTFSVVLDFVTFFACFCASVVTWLSLPALGKASGIPMVNMLASGLLATLFATLAALVEPSLATLNRSLEQTQARRAVVEKRAKALADSLLSTNPLLTSRAWSLVLLAGATLGLTQGLCWVLLLGVAGEPLQTSRVLLLVLILISWQSLQLGFHVWRQTLKASSTAGRIERFCSVVLPGSLWLLYLLASVALMFEGSYAAAGVLMVGLCAPSALARRLQNSHIALTLCHHEVQTTLDTLLKGEKELRRSLRTNQGLISCTHN